MTSTIKLSPDVPDHNLRIEWAGHMVDVEIRTDNYPGRHGKCLEVKFDGNAIIVISSKGEYGFYTAKPPEVPV